MIRKEKDSKILAAVLAIKLIPNFLL